MCSGLHLSAAGLAIMASLGSLIREYAELFKPEPWTPPSPAMRRLCELQTMRAGIIRSRTEWKNRSGSGLGDSTATKLAAATITHFTRQLEAIPSPNRSESSFPIASILVLSVN
jgi:hypothetical protein